eukprot:COSAG04_NODE_15136_length_542_cov_1.045147_1_plen_42_part_10
MEPNAPRQQAAKRSKDLAGKITRAGERAGVLLKRLAHSHYAT